MEEGEGVLEGEGDAFEDGADVVGAGVEAVMPTKAARALGSRCGVRSPKR